MSKAILKAETFLQNFKGKNLSSSQRLLSSIELADLLLEATVHETTFAEKKREKRLAKMMEDARGKIFLTAMTDQCFRSQNAHRTADQLTFLLKKYGIPTFLDEDERIKMLIFKLFGRTAPHFFVPQVKKQIRNELSHVILPQDPKERKSYLEKRRIEKTRINLNHLGEAILGEDEAHKRLNVYLKDLSNPSIDYISIKISTLYSQIHLIGWEKTLAILAERLRLLYREAIRNPIFFPDGSHSYKFVNLDMEESKDLDLTVALFQKVLDEPEFHSLSAGIVLQSYLPESYAIQITLTEWALKRVNEGRAPVKIRIVKGANLSMEIVEASQKGWPQAPFLEKEESDANFKRMIEYALLPQHAKAVHIGIGSHNLLDISYALILRAETSTEKSVSFEMLEGMAEPMRRVIQKVAGNMLLYCPEAEKKDFHTAVAYLIRRLDENTGPKNFLRHLFELHPQSQSWENEIGIFKSGHVLIEHLSSEKKRTQNRFKEPFHPLLNDPFINEPDTDFSLKSNREWVHEIYTHWKEKKHPPIPLVIGGENYFESMQNGVDPSFPDKILYQYSLADNSLIKKAMTCAKENEVKWKETSLQERSKILANAAQFFRFNRNVLIGAMIADAGKVVLEADTEVSEAIDFIEYYRRNWEKIISYSEVQWAPRGTILIAPPWNFPCSIPVGGISAALMAGNCVLFKPAPETVLVGWHLIQQFWAAGIPKEVLQWINCSDDPVGSELICDERLDGVVLTGATATARKLISLRPALHLIAETGGKNAMIITTLSDRDLAIRDLIHSAFGHAGQKCSACSLAILEKDVYEDSHFLEQLKDATKSLQVGSAWDPNTKIPPLIRLPEGPLKRAFKELDEGESWLLEPQQDPFNPKLWSPGIKMGVRKNSFTHQTELFGPILGIMKAESLEEAIHLANATPYGLTSGLHSLDEREHEEWRKKMYAGNLYINRTITGAIVRRQPFGGCKASSFGLGAKAGGPNYVQQLATSKQVHLPQERGMLPAEAVPLFQSLSSFAFSDEEIELLKRSAESYAHWASILKEATDVSCVVGQDNYFYHVPREKITLRLSPASSLLDIFRICIACLVCKTPLTISSAHPTPGIELFKRIVFFLENEEEFLKNVESGSIFFIRYLGIPSSLLLKSAAKMGVPIFSSPVLASGRFELLHYLREVSLSHDYHRYGNLGAREPGITWKKN